MHIGLFFPRDARVALFSMEIGLSGNNGNLMVSNIISCAARANVSSFASSVLLSNRLFYSTRTAYLCGFFGVGTFKLVFICIRVCFYEWAFCYLC